MKSHAGLIPLILFAALAACGDSGAGSETVTPDRPEALAWSESPSVAPPERLIQFPPDRAMGWFGVRAWGSDDEWGVLAPDGVTVGAQSGAKTGWRAIFESRESLARGDVLIPPGLEVALAVDADKLSPLSNFRPDDLQGLRIFPSPGLEYLQFRHLGGMTLVRELDLSGTLVSDDDLIHLKSFTRLEKLNLSASNVSDGGLAHLKALPALRRLYLADNPISNRGLSHLEKLVSLELLDVTVTRVTPEGIERLKKALPDCVILGMGASATRNPTPTPGQRPVS